MEIEGPELSRLKRERLQLKQEIRSILDSNPSNREMERADELLNEAEEIDEKIDRLEAGVDDGPEAGRLAFENEGGSMDNNRTERVEFEDKYGTRHVGVRGGNFYETLAEERGWPDRDNVESVGERIAAQVSGERALSSTGGLSGAISDPARAMILDRLVNQSFLREAGAVFLSPESETLTVSRVDEPAGLEWLSPGSSASSTDPVFKAQTLDFKTFRGSIKINRETVQDAEDLPDAIERELTRTMREELERVALVGQSTAGEPQGVAGSTQVNSVNISGSTGGGAIASSGPGYVDVLQAKERLQNDNVPESNLSQVMAPRTDRQFQSLQDANNRFLEAPQAVQNMRRFVTSAMPTTFAPSTSLTDTSKIVVGDWNDFLVGLRLDPNIEAFRSVDSGSYQLRLVPAMRMDVIPQRPDSFEVIERITT